MNNNIFKAVSDKYIFFYSLHVEELYICSDAIFCNLKKQFVLDMNVKEILDHGKGE